MRMGCGREHPVQDVRMDVPQEFVDWLLNYNSDCLGGIVDKKVYRDATADTLITVKNFSPACFPWLEKVVSSGSQREMLKIFLVSEQYYNVEDLQMS